ncbi:MAG TPA: hypothetical protein V6D47_04370 [Oscillatoriaceae cyanobacterium]
MSLKFARATLALTLFLVAGCASRSGLMPAPGKVATFFHPGLTAPPGAHAPRYGLQALPTSPHLLGSAFLDANPGNTKLNVAPILAFDSQDDTYLAVWRNLADGSLHGRIKDHFGQTQVPDFKVSAYGELKENGKAVYLPWLNQFAVVYDTPYAIPWGLYFQRISSSGALVGSPVLVSAASGERGEPDLAVDPIHHRVEVVWHDDRSGDFDVYGRLLTFNGNQTLFLTNETLIANSPPDPDNGYQSAHQSWPTIDFGTQQQKYVVAWQDQRDETIDGDDVWARVLDANGLPVTDQYVVSNLEGDQNEPSIAYLAASDKFLLAFTSANNGDTDTDMLASGLDGDGTVLGWGTIDNQLGNQNWPDVAANNASWTWLVGYVDDFNNQEADGDSRILGRHVGWAFQLGDVFDISPLQPVFEDNLGIAANTDDQEFLVDYVRPCSGISGAPVTPQIIACSNSDIEGQRVDRGY